MKNRLIVGLFLLGTFFFQSVTNPKQSTEGEIRGHIQTLLVQGKQQLLFQNQPNQKHLPYPNTLTFLKAVEWFSFKICWPNQQIQGNHPFRACSQPNESDFLTTIRKPFSNDSSYISLFDTLQASLIATSITESDVIVGISLSQY